MTHTVLIVEDDAELRDLMCEALELSGYSAVGASNGKEAFDALARIEHVCLVILDLLMPIMNGWDFYTALQLHPTHASVPVIVHTSEPAQAPGGTRVLQKPIKLERLLSVVQEYCAQS